MKKICLEPWIDSNPIILIVGTMPGEQSLQDQSYYANPRNKFWKYIEAILNNGIELKSKEDKQKLLYSNGIGLWDTLSICDRKGSLDSHIKNYQPNDFSKFQSVKFILCNGKKAYQYFTRYNADYLQNRECIELPSTSPANASISDDVKFAKWKKALMSRLNKGT